MDLLALRGAAYGERCAETAEREHRSVHTIRCCRHHAMTELGAKTIAHAVYLALDEILELGPPKGA